MQESKQETQFRIGGVYRQRDGALIQLACVPLADLVFRRVEDGSPAVALYVDSRSEDGWRRLEDGIYVDGEDDPEDGGHLIPGELHQVDGQWVPLDEKQEEKTELHRAIERITATPAYKALTDPNAAMIDRDNTAAAIHYANKRAFIAKMAQVVADRAAKSTTKPPIAGLTRVSAQDHRVGGWGFVR